METKQKEITRYSDNDLAIFDDIIDKKIAKTQEEINFYKNQLTDFGENEETKFKNLSESTTASDVERIHNLLGRQQKLLVHLNNAKLRIKNKVYGVCRETGELISKERLMAVPHATLSIKAKQRK